MTRLDDLTARTLAGTATDAERAELCEEVYQRDARGQAIVALGREAPTGALPCRTCSRPLREHLPRGGCALACPEHGTTYQSPEV